MRTCLFLVLLTGFFTCTLSLHAQSPAVEWHKVFGTNDGEYATDVLPTADGGFIVSGYSVGRDNGDLSGYHGFGNSADLWIIKVNKSGKIEWQKVLGGTDSDAGTYILPSADGGYMVAASVASVNCNLSGGRGGFDYWLAKLNVSGDIVWQKKYGGTGQEYVTAFSASADGGYFLSGNSDSRDGDVTGNHGVNDFWVIKVDASGKLLWQKSLGGSDYEDATSVQGTPDGGCILAGSVSSFDGDLSGSHQYNDYWVIKLDKNGALQWQRTLGGSMSDFGSSVRVCKDGGYIVSGHANSSDGDVSGTRLAFDAWIIKLDKSGNKLWEKTYGGFQNETARSIKETPDGGFVFAGMSASSDGDITCNSGQSDVLVMKIDATGTLLWQKTMGGSQYDEAFDIEPLQDGSFIVAGITESPEMPGYHSPTPTRTGLGDFWLIKLSPPSNTTPAPVVTIDPASATICKGGAMTLSATVQFGGIIPSYQWMKNGIPVGNNSCSYTDPTLNNNDQVTCVVTSQETCTSAALQGSDRVTIRMVTNNTPPAISIAADNIVACNCATITINARVTGAGGSAKYKWKINGTELDYNYPTLVSNNLKAGDEIVCSYSDNLTCSGTILSNPIKILNGAAIPAVSIVASADTVCKDGTVIFTATPVNAGTNPSYQWKINGVAAGTNNAVFTSSSITDGAIVSCVVTVDPLFICASGKSATSNNIVMHVTAQSTPTVDVVASSESICTGSTVTFTATAKNAGASPNYQWKLNGSSIGTNSSVFSSSTLANNDVITCTVDADRRYACALFNQVVSKSIKMTVRDGALPTVSISAVQNDVCPGTDISFTAVAANAGTAPEFQWTLNGSPLSGSAPGITISNLANDDKVMCFVIPGAGSCSANPEASNVISASILAAPIISISPADTIIPVGSQVELRVSVAGSIQSFTWMPSDRLVNSQLLSPQTIPLKDNSNFQLTVVGDNGCKAEAISVVKVSTVFAMPNAFTPNNDGRNDLFKIPETANLSLIDFSVFNRWGNAIFITKDRHRGWDGSYQNTSPQAGTYVYVIRYKVDGMNKVMKGTVMLVR